MHNTRDYWTICYYDSELYHYDTNFRDLNLLRLFSPPLQMSVPGNDHKYECICHIYDPDELLANSKTPAKPALVANTDVNIHELVKPFYDELVSIRRDLHQIPELAFTEVKTAKYVYDKLQSYASLSTHTADCLTLVDKIGQTGVVGVTHGLGAPAVFTAEELQGHDRYCILLRADMDGLPVKEILTEKNTEYISTNGCMHACGHDGHMSMLLVAARVLTSTAYRHTIPSNVSIKFVFQPAEEKDGGGKAMIDDGVLELNDTTGPYVHEVYGCHLWSFAPVGHIWTRNGSFMAACDDIFITVKGSGGHGAVPQGTKDAVLIGSHLVTQLHTIVSRNIAPVDSAVVTIGTFNSGYTSNVISDAAYLSGTVRSLNRDTQKLLKKRIEDVCKGIATSYDCEVICNYSYVYPATINEISCVDVVADVANQIVGSAHVDTNVLPTMGAEDFSFFLNSRKGCFYFVGACPDNNLSMYPHHKNSFDINENALPVGASMFVSLIDKLTSRLQRQ